MGRTKHSGVEGSTTPSGSDFLQLDLADAPSGGRTAWLARRLRDAVLDGRLPAGSTLPPSRTLAADLGVSRGVVTEAYQRLTEEGHAVGNRRGGTVVTSMGRPAPPATGLGTKGGDTARDVLRDTGRNTASPAEHFVPDPAVTVFEDLRNAAARIDLSPGVPDLAAFPRAAWLRAEKDVLDRVSARDLGYADPHGAAPLRRAVAVWLARTRAITVAPRDVVIVAGVSQGLSLLAQALGRRGEDAVGVEDPGSLGVRQLLGSWGMATPPVPVDEAGVRVDRLDELGTRAVMVTPAHQFPTGVVLDGSRRADLVRWARRRGGLVIEDDYDAEHRYDRPPVAALHPSAPDHVYYAGSVSKLIAPAVRVGWVIAPSSIRDDIVALKRDTDLGNAVLPQLTLAAFLDDGGMERHLRVIRRRHRGRRDAMIRAIRHDLPDAIVHGAAAGLHVTVTFDDAPEGADLTIAAACLDRGVKVQPLAWHRQTPGPPGLVLGYASVPAGAIAEGVGVAARVARSVLTSRRRGRRPAPSSRPR